MRMTPLLCLLVLACGRNSVDDDKDGFVPNIPDEDGERDDTGDGGEDTGEAPDPEPPLECDPMPALPLADERLTGTPPSEDFAFDLEGRLVNVDNFGNLVATTLSGERTVLVPGLNMSAGLAFLPGGDIVYNDVGTNTVKRVNLSTGAVTTLTAGMAYPNGLGVGLDGFVYVAENSGGRVRRIDPDTGDYEVISIDTLFPNGISFSPDYETVYVGSFGGGTVYALSKDEEGVWTTNIVSSVPKVEGPGPCDTALEGDQCFFPSGGVGTCRTGLTDALTCEPGVRDREACEGAEEDDPCVTELMGRVYTSRCRPLTVGEGLYCPAHDGDTMDACSGLAMGGDCSVDGVAGYCYPSWQGENICLLDSVMVDAANTCDGLVAGDTCLYDYPYLPTGGVCTDDGRVVSCVPTYGGFAALDGLNTDACGTVYATDYGGGNLWRLTPDGSVVEVAANLTATWIPNMHFGRGVGGFEEDVLYVMNLDRGGLFAVDLGLPGKAEPYTGE